ncbi:MAG: ABC transporter substrate-binding protein [Rhodospirillaceae bacterium]|nr:ABC transporter substrate-binding protein [Rhodospirillaceae bacterium]
MLKKSIAIAMTLGVAIAAPQLHAQETLRVGLVSTLTGPGAGLGLELKNGWDVGVAALGGKIGGLETRIFVVDDQLKTDVAVSGVDQLVSQHKVHVVAGILWSNVMLAVYERAIKANTIVLSTNAGPPQLAGRNCSPLYMSTSWQNDEFMETTALLVKADGIKSVLLTAPNYQAGKDLMTAFPKNYSGKIVDQILFKLGTTDFQAELSVIGAKKPEAVVVFAPGAMAVAFLKQWHASGLGKKIKLYTINMVDSLSLPAIGDTVVGTSHVSPYDPTGASDANQKFVKAYVAKTGRMPTQYAAQAYDAVFLIDSGVRAVGGKLGDKAALIRAMRKGAFPSVRGHLAFNINNFPIQDFHKLEVVLGADKKPAIKGAGIVVKDHKDSYAAQCKLTW